MHTITKFISVQKQSKRKSHREKKETKKQEARTVKNTGTEYRARTIKKNMQKIKKMKLKRKIPLQGVEPATFSFTHNAPTTLSYAALRFSAKIFGLSVFTAE